MIISYANGWAKTIDLNGRTNRKEFWAFAIIDLITIPIAFYLIDLVEEYYEFPPVEGQEIGSFFSYFYIFIVLILGWFPRLTILIRRIRDTGRNIIWIFWYLFPIVGWLVLIILTLQPTYSKNRDALPVKFLDNLNEENLDKKTNQNSLQSKLEELKRLKDKKLVSNKEYEELRKKILDL